MYAQIFAFTVVSFILIGFYFSHHAEAKEAEVEIPEEDIDAGFQLETIAEGEKPVSELNYLDVIYEESHQETGKIKDLRLHSKNKK